MLCDSSVGLQELYRALVLGQVQPPFLGKLRLGRALLLLQRTLHVISPFNLTAHLMDMLWLTLLVSSQQACAASSNDTDGAAPGPAMKETYTLMLHRQAESLTGHRGGSRAGCQGGRSCWRGCRQGSRAGCLTRADGHGRGHGGLPVAGIHWRRALAVKIVPRAPKVLRRNDAMSAAV